MLLYCLFHDVVFFPAVVLLVFAVITWMLTGFFFFYSYKLKKKTNLLPSFHFLVYLWGFTSCFSIRLLPSSDGPRHHMQCVFTVFLPFSIVSFLHNFCTFFLFYTIKERRHQLTSLSVCVNKIEPGRNLSLVELLRTRCGGEAGPASVFTDVWCACGRRRRCPAGRACQRTDGHRCNLHHIWRAPQISRRKVKTLSETHTRTLVQITTFATSVYNLGGQVNLEGEPRQNSPARCFWRCRLGTCMCPVLQNRRGDVM